MASSNKTEKLGLSLWDSTDRPERMDFVKDNEILEQVLGEHLANSLLHVDPGKKDFLDQPFWIQTATGTSSDSRYAPAGGLPKLIIQMCTSYPPVVPRPDGKLDVYWDFFYTLDGTYKNTYSLGGLDFDTKEKRWVCHSRTSPVNKNLVMHMNDQGLTYVVLFLPFTN